MTVTSDLGDTEVGDVSIPIGDGMTCAVGVMGISAGTETSVMGGSPGMVGGRGVTGVGLRPVTSGDAAMVGKGDKGVGHHRVGITAAGAGGEVTTSAGWPDTASSGR